MKCDFALFSVKLRLYLYIDNTLNKWKTQSDGLFSAHFCLNFDLNLNTRFAHFRGLTQSLSQEYLDALDRRSYACDVAAMIGHGPLRAWVRGPP